jgi:cell division protein FtsQ
MNAQTVRRGGGGRGRSGKAPARGAKGLGRALPAPQRSAKGLARWAFLLFALALGAVAIIALDIPAKAAQAAGSAAGQAGFAVNGYQIVGLKRMDRALVDDVVTAELQRAAEASDGRAKAAQLLVDVDAIRENLLRYGWVQDARVSRRLPDQLVIDIVERRPAALWQNRQQLSLIDADGVVLAPVPVDQMPDLPLLIGPGANQQATALNGLLARAPTLKPQVDSATWIGRRRWNLAFTSGETLMLPEGTESAAKALERFAKEDRRVGLLARGYRRFDLRVPGRMAVQLPQGAAEELANQSMETPS